MDKATLNVITQYLIRNVFRNGDVMYGAGDEDIHSDLIDIIATLHNYLYESVTGEKYNYMWHWANKVGSWCDDNVDMTGQREDGDING